MTSAGIWMPPARPGQKDNKKALPSLRAVADELKLRPLVLARRPGAGQDDRLWWRLTRSLRRHHEAHERQCAEGQFGRRSHREGKIKTKADLDKAIDKAARADMERRWLVTDVTTWYPVSEEPQRHFTDAIAAYSKKDYKAAATDIRKATSYLRLQAGRATAEAKQELNSSVAQLDTLAASVEKGAVKDEQSMAKAFAKADHALALQHRSMAAESWARKEYDKAGYELKAAAHGFESAAGWVGGEAKAGASATVADTRALGDKLAAGVTWTRDEVVKGFDSLGNGITALGQKIGNNKKASPFDVGA